MSANSDSLNPTMEYRKFEQKEAQYDIHSE